MTYKVPAKCCNCDHTTELKVPLGIRVIVFTPGYKCGYCGCTGTMQKVERKTVFVPDLPEGHEVFTLG